MEWDTDNQWGQAEDDYYYPAEDYNGFGYENWGWY